MDERDRLSLVGHAGLPTMSPLNTAELERLIEACALSPGDRVLDLGCGRGDLARIAARSGASVIGVDRSPAACDEARRRTGDLEAVTIVCDDARAYLARERPQGLALASAIGALHAFGTRLASWTGALDALAPIARRALLVDMVATGSRAVETFEIATRGELAPLEARASHTLVLSADRVIAYERAWCAAVAASPAARPDDPRSTWIRERIAWSESSLDAWREVELLALVL